MSSDANHQQYSGQPAGPPPQYQQQPNPPQPPPGYGPPAGPPAGYPAGPPQPNPYVVPGAPDQGLPQGGGGQPPYLPPGAYVPGPPPPPQGRGRSGKVALAAILSIVLVAAAAAVVLFKFVFVSGPDPAESFPATASVYVEINLDPSLDQTPKLLDHLGKFGDLDYDSTDDMIADLLEEAGLDDVDAEKDLTSWLGNRHGIAMWTHDDHQYGVISLASTDADAAEDGLANLRAAAEVEEDQLAYTVEDDHVLMVVGDSGAADALAAAEREAGDTPLSASSGYEDARSWLDGDQLVVTWVDMDAVADLAAMEAGDEAAELIKEAYSGQMIAGLAAFDEGFELNYRHFGAENDQWTGSENLMSTMGDMPAGDFAAAAYLPENLGELADEWTGLAEDLYGGDDAYATEPGDPLTADEYEEYLELQYGYYADTLTEDEESRYLELEERYWSYGTEEDPWGGEDDYSYGPDFEEIEEVVDEVTDLLSGASLSASGNFDAESDVNPDSLYFAAKLAEDRAQELEDLIEEMSGGEALPDGVDVNGSEITYTGADAPSGTLSEDARFSDFADAAPGQCSVAIWVDLAAAGETYPDDFEGVEALSAIAWAHGSEDGDGTGVVRLYLKD